MFKSLKSMVIVLFVVLSSVPLASAAQVVVVRPYLVRPYYYGFYGPAWYSPSWRPWWGPAYVPMPRTGNVKIETRLTNASIYVDGGYAGVTGHLKKFPLRPGSHDIELRDAGGRIFYRERVAVFASRTTKIRVDQLG